MRAGISILILIAVSTGAFADDSNVYNDFLKWMKSLPNATVDEQVTALIKRHMANLLYPVDMASFARPEKDVKFREQIMALQKQMGEPPTGTLTSDQFDRLAEAAHDIDSRSIGTWPGKIVDRSGELVWAVGTGTTDDRDDPLAHPINIIFRNSFLVHHHDVGTSSRHGHDRRTVWHRVDEHRHQKQISDNFFGTSLGFIVLPSRKKTLDMEARR